MTQQFTVPGWHPVSVNQLIGYGIAKRNRLKRGDADLVIFYSRQAGVTPATGPRRVRFTIALKPGQRACDPDNYKKSMLDSLKTAGLIIDDNRQKSIVDPPEFARDFKHSTTIELIDVDIPETAKRPRKPAKGAKRP